MTGRFPRVCFVQPNAYPLLSGDQELPLIGGAELQAAIVAKHLAARGHQVSMICLDFGQPEQVVIDNIRIFRAYRPDEGLPILRFVWPRLLSIWNCMNRADADVYYQRTAGMLTGVMAAFCKFRGRKSVFASASNPDLLPNTSRIRYARDRWIYSYGLKNVDRIFVQNEEQARICRSIHRREPILIPNCYATSDRRSVEREEGYILWVSTIRKLKRPELFLELARALPDQQFRMIGGPGDGEHELYDAIKARATTMNNVQFLGFVPFAPAEKHFDRATIFVNTSESEGFPNTFLQAWARGVPTVSFVDPGSRLANAPIGLRVATFQEMISVVAQLVSNESDRVAEGRRSAKYVELNHAPEKIVKLYERAFEELVKPIIGGTKQAPDKVCGVGSGEPLE